DLMVLPDEVGHLHMIRDFGARTGRLSDHREDEARVVRPCVVVHARPGQIGPGEAWFSLRCGIGSEPNPSGQRFLREDIVKEQAEPEEDRARTPSPVGRDHERERMNESGSGFQETVPLSDREADESDFVVLEIPESAVDQARGLSTRATGEVSTVDQGGPKAASRRVARDPGTNDAAADDEDVEEVPLHPREARGPGAGGEFPRHILPSMSFPGFMISSGSGSRFKARSATMPSLRKFGAGRAR